MKDMRGGIILEKMLWRCCALLIGGICFNTTSTALSYCPVSDLERIASEPPLSLDAKNITATDRIIGQYGELYIATDALQYSNNSKIAFTEGETSIWGEGIYLHTTTPLTLNNNAEKISAQSIEYFLLENRAYGYGNSMNHTKKNTVLHDATFSTCDPINPLWTVKIRKLELRHDKNIGIARHATLIAKKLPVLYFPYLTFPLTNKRQSGFLMPKILHSRSAGGQIYIPYYWNIAPEMDATFGPRYLQKRGIMAIGEFRYLTNYGRGKLSTEYLAKDWVTQNSRHYIRYEHQEENLPFNSQFHGSFVGLSENTYFRDFGTTLEAFNTDYQTRHATLRSHGRFGNLLIDVRHYQSSDPGRSKTELPYSTFPRINGNILQSFFSSKNLQINLESEYVHFQRNNIRLNTLNSSTDRIDRFYLKPSIQYSILQPGYEFISRASVHSTQYKLSHFFNRQASTINRAVPIFSVSGNVFLERDVTLFNTDYIDTLEPKLFYLYVPYRNQDSIPVTDSAMYTNAPSRVLFRENRYIGLDRIGDTHQVTVGLKKRLLQKNGTPIAQLQLTQAFYMQERRRVLFPNEVRDDSHYSPTGLEGKINLPAGFGVSAQYTSNFRSPLRESVLLEGSYQKTTQQSVKVGYYSYAAPFSTTPATNQTDKQVYFHINWAISNIAIQMHIAYETERKMVVNSGIGMQFNYCCFSLGIAAKRYYINQSTSNTSVNGRYENIILLNVSLPGLSDSVDKPNSLLKGNIGSY